MSEMRKQSDQNGEPKPCTYRDIIGMAVIDVCSTTKPNLAGLLGKTRATTYAEVRRGLWPSIGGDEENRRIYIPVPKLLAQLGVEQER